MFTGALRRHECMIYDGSPSRTLPALAATIRQSLGANVRCMYLNSPTMVAGFRSQLYAMGTDVEHELARGALVLVADSAHLVDGRFDVNQMIDMLEAAVQTALADGYAGLLATGDMTWEFGSEKELAKLLEYEWCLEQLFQRQAALSGICQYHRDLLPHEAVREGLASHASLYINDTISRLNPHYAPARSPDERRAAASPGLDDALPVLLAVP
ncbi:MAG: MEDS domain-containing protein [Deltaproteobacteria bacterium]|nr:MEDS domain-containing protein [Deltaproteobacteria bacterium]